VTRAQARAARDAARALVANGDDPSEAKQARKRQEAERGLLTFETQARACAAKSAKEGKAAATLAKTDWLPGMAIAHFGGKPIATPHRDWFTMPTADRNTALSAVRRCSANAVS
jgi:hypothetical protein